MIIYYYGTGKGKTTAGLGALVRAKESGKSILLIQALKHNTIESKVLNGHCFGDAGFIKGSPQKKHYVFAKSAFDFFKAQAKNHDVVMFDELPLLLYYKLLDPKSVLAEISKYSGAGYPVLIITGRPKLKKIVVVADIVTEMKEKKHIYSKGVRALKGIDF